MQQCFSASRASHEEGFAASGCFLGKLVEGQAASAGGKDALAGRFGESQGAHIELRDIKDSLVVNHSANSHHSLVLGFAEVLNDSGNADGVFGDVGLLESFQDHCVELGTGSSG